MQTETIKCINLLNRIQHLYSISMISMYTYTISAKHTGCWVSTLEHIIIVLCIRAMFDRNLRGIKVRMSQIIVKNIYYSLIYI